MSNPKPRLVLLCKVQGPLRASVLKSHLESEGIPAMLKYESAGLVYGLAVDGLGEVRVLVPEDMLEDARQVIEPQEYDAEGGEEDEEEEGEEQG